MKKNEAWVVLDLLHPIYDECDIPETVIHDQIALEQALTGYVEREPPSIILLKTSSLGRFRIGIGGDFASLEWFPNPSPLESYIAQPNEIVAPGIYEFIMEGHHTPFSPHHLFRAEEIIEFLLYVYQHNSIPNWSSLAEIQPLSVAEKPEDILKPPPEKKSDNELFF